MTDLRLPGAPGLEVTRKARALPNPPAVLVVSGFATETDQATIESAGAQLLRKPFSARTLREAVRHALDTQR